MTGPRVSKLFYKESKSFFFAGVRGGGLKKVIFLQRIQIQKQGGGARVNISLKKKRIQIGKEKTYCFFFFLQIFQ